MPPTLVLNYLTKRKRLYHTHNRCIYYLEKYTHKRDAANFYIRSPKMVKNCEGLYEGFVCHL